MRVANRIGILGLCLACGGLGFHLGRVNLQRQMARQFDQIRAIEITRDDGTSLWFQVPPSVTATSVNGGAVLPVKRPANGPPRAILGPGTH